MNWQGIIVGICLFLLIGLLHVVVVKVEYHFGKDVWPVFFAAGTACVVASLLTSGLTLSILLAVLGFSLFWSIKELYEQEKRVQRGWFPKNPKRKRQ